MPWLISRLIWVFAGRISILLFFFFMNDSYLPRAYERANWLLDWHLTSLHVRKYTFWHTRPTMTQISLRIRAVWWESSLSVGKKCILCYSKCTNSYEIRMRRLILIFAWRTSHGTFVFWDFWWRRLYSRCTETSDNDVRVVFIKFMYNY